MARFFLARFSQQPSETEEPKYDRYVIDGHRAGSVQLTVNYGNLLVKDLFVSTPIRNSIFTIIYGAPVSIFDKNLPVVENMINSIKLTP